MAKKVIEPVKNGKVIESLDEYDRTFSSRIICAEELRAFTVSPMHYKNYLESETEQVKMKREMMLQEALATYFQNPENFAAKYIALKNRDLPAKNVYGDQNYTKKENRDYRDRIFPLMCKDKIVLTEEEHDLVEAIGKANYENQYIRKIAESGPAMLSIYKQDPKTSLIMKTRASGFVSSNKITAFDFHIVRYASLNNYPKTIFGNGGHNLAVWNMDLLDMTNYVVFAFENTPPYVCQPFVLTPDVIERARGQNRMLLDIFYWTKKTGFTANYYEFDRLKQFWAGVVDYSYIGPPCSELDKIDTNFRLDLFHESNDGVHPITLPGWVK